VKIVKLILVLVGRWKFIAGGGKLWNCRKVGSWKVGRKGVIGKLLEIRFILFAVVFIGCLLVFTFCLFFGLFHSSRSGHRLSLFVVLANLFCCRFGLVLVGFLFFKCSNNLLSALIKNLISFWKMAVFEAIKKFPFSFVI
jgi:hypothetical protein